MGHVLRSAQEHYSDYLAPIYAWSVGGTDKATAALARWFDTLPVKAAGEVLDLGAGFGAASLPLAKRGWRVHAVDSSAELLEVLDQAALQQGLDITTVQGDLVVAVDNGPTVDLILCLGDTLPHLESHTAVEALIQGIAARLNQKGYAVLSYRPSAVLTGPQRFFQVRSDDERTLTCFIETLDEQRVAVWDLLHTHHAGQTTLQVSGYPKLRLDPHWVAALAGDAGLSVEAAPDWHGMTVQVLRKTL